MIKKRTFIVSILALIMTFSSIFSNVVNAETVLNRLTIADMPPELKPSIEWVYNNRMIKVGTPTYKNLIFDQIFAGNGTLNYVVRWQSSKTLSLEQRKKIAAMLKRQVNNWTKHLTGYDEWPYDTINVNVVGWACAEASLILDKQPDEIVYTDCIEDGLSKNQPSIPSKLPCAPSSLSRIDHFRDSNYTYPGGLDKRFDMYLWVTTNFKGGAGGDWGQRVADSYILSTVDLNDVHIIEHEMGHGFGFPDFYEEADIPEGGFPVPTIMWGGNSTTITSWDVWLLRYTWSMLKKDTTRFKAVYQPMVTYGDLNNDGAINSIDFALLKKSVLSDSTEGINAEAADLNKDKSINALDLALMKSYLLGNLKAF